MTKSTQLREEKGENTRKGSEYVYIYGLRDRGITIYPTYKNFVLEIS
jgi:hypothetical protein